MISKPSQFCKIMHICIKQFSKDTTMRVADLLTSHERVFQIEKMIDKNPTEQEFLKMLDKEFPTAE